MSNVAVSKIYLGSSEQSEACSLFLRMANRHGLIAGATGTGKTTSLQLLVEGFSRLGVPVFVPDIKGDLSGVAKAGTITPKIQERLRQLHIQDFSPSENPAIFWDLEGKVGHPLRTTVSEMGPLLFSRLLDLNDTQSGLLSLIFSIADKNGMLLIDLDDLTSVINWVEENQDNFKGDYGIFSPATIGTIKRKVVEFTERGGSTLFGEPAIKLSDLMRTTIDGRGYINILDASEVVSDPRFYTSFLLWLLSELFEELPEVGDLDRPRLVFFFDEAHLLFQDASPALIEKVEMVARLIRSKGVGIYFITQDPQDIPLSILGQLSNRIQHAMRAFTPKDKKAVKTIAQTLRENPHFDTEAVITTLGIGEALVSCLLEDGTPSVVQKLLISPPSSRLGPLLPEERTALIKTSPVFGVYEAKINRESAAELIKARREGLKNQPSSLDAKVEKEKPSELQKAASSMFQSFMRSMGSKLGREIMRGVLGSISGSRR